MANKKISQLTSAGTLNDADVLPIVNGGATRKLALSTLTDYIGPATGPTGADGVGEAYQGPTAPAEASAGATWLSTSDGKYFVRYDGVWVEVA